MNNVAMIIAGGVGSRMGLDIPKQFVEINGKPLIIYTLEKFNNNNNIDYICIACHVDWIERLWKYVRQYNINKVKIIVEGGRSGLSSAHNGIVAIDEFERGNDAIILIHDAVRPFVDDECIDNNIEVASKNGLAMCAAPLVETLAYSEDFLYSNKLIPRDNLYKIQTPQTFRLSILKNLYDSVDIENSKEPSTFALYMSQGLPIYISRGNEKNIKITYPEDLQYFKKFF